MNPAESDLSLWSFFLALALRVLGETLLSQIGPLGGILGLGLGVEEQTLLSQIYPLGGFLALRLTV